MTASFYYFFERLRAHKMRTNKKIMTTPCHYKASVMLHDLLSHNVVPDYVTWEIRDVHLDILRLFIVEGLTVTQISKRPDILSKRGRPMSPDTILYWIKRYIPYLEFDKKKSAAKRNHDPEEARAMRRFRSKIPKSPCVICGSEDNLELDHIIPYCAGGRATSDNLQWLCHSCHLEKTKAEARCFA